MFDNEFLASSKQLKRFPRDSIFQSNRRTYVITTPWCLMYSGLMLEDIIMDLSSYITKQTTDSVNNDSFPKIQDYRIYLYKGSMQDYS